MTQDERLTIMLEAFRREADRRTLDTLKKAGLTRNQELRALMNLRPPRELAPALLSMQDEFLQQLREEKGDVSLEGLDETEHRITLWQGDITRLAVDAIVNAANSQMLGCFQPLHSCIDNCIHSYAGVELRLECFRQMRMLQRKYGEDYEQPTAIPLITDAYNLPAKRILHVVGPIVQGPLLLRHETALRDCYLNCLELCEREGLHSLAFCCISTGVFHFPAERASEIAVETVRRWLKEHSTGLERVVFVVHSDRSRRIYEQALGTSEDRPC